MSVATWERSFRRAPDAYESDSATMVVDLAKQFADPQSRTGALVRKLRNDENAEFSAAVIGKLQRILAGDRRRKVAPTFSVIRFALDFGRGMVTDLDEEMQGLSPPQWVATPSGECQGLNHRIVCADTPERQCSYQRR